MTSSFGDASRAFLAGRTSNHQNIDVKYNILSGCSVLASHFSERRSVPVRTARSTRLARAD